MGTPHNEAKKGDFAKTVLMPGDPLRSKFIAENFLTDLKLVNNVRGVQGYTGTYKGVKVSVMASTVLAPILAAVPFQPEWDRPMQRRTGSTKNSGTQSAKKVASTSPGVSVMRPSTSR